LEEFQKSAMVQKSQIMKQITFSKFALIVCAICLAGILFTTSAFCQDTIPTKKVLVVNQELSRKTGKVQRQWFRKMTVKSGYIVKLPNGFYLINGKEMKPNDFSYTALKDHD
jgi:hypothetical protein